MQRQYRIPKDLNLSEDEKRKAMRLMTGHADDFLRNVDQSSFNLYSEEIFVETEAGLTKHILLKDKGLYTEFVAFESYSATYFGEDEQPVQIAD